MIVRWAPTADADLRAKSRAAVAGRMLRRLKVTDTELLEVPAGASVEVAVRRLARRPGVVWAEPNQLYRALDVPADPLFGQQWALRNTGQTIGGLPGLLGADIGISPLWERTLGDEAVTVAVVDTGVALDHPDLPDRVLDGYDFVEDDAVGQDWNGHGTAVAGVIAAERGATGIVGVAPRVRVMPLRVLDAEGVGTTVGLAEGVDFAGKRGVPIVNVSLGGPRSELLGEAIARHPDTLFVVASGNSGGPMDYMAGLTGLHYPCRFSHENVLCVTASDARDERPPYASWGKVSADLAAPGHLVLAPALSDAVVFEDDFETPVDDRWTAGGQLPGWARTDDWAATGGFSFGYAPSADARTPGRRWAEIGMTFSDDVWKDRLACHVDFHLRFQAGGGRLRVESRWQPYSDDWAALRTFEQDTDGRVAVPLDGPSTTTRFTELRFTVDTPEGLQPTQAHGAWIDDVGVRCRGKGVTGDTWGLVSGSSFAAPHVSGVAALVRSLSPDMRPEEMRARIVCGAMPVAAWKGLTVSGGRLDGRGALETALGAPLPRWSGRIDRLFDPSVAQEPRGMAPLPNGGLVYADTGRDQVMRWIPGQDPVPIAGDPDAVPETGDGGPALAAGVYRPLDVAARPDGSILVVTQRVRVIGVDGIIRPFAGDQTDGYSGDGGPAVSAGLGYPNAVAAAPDGSVYIVGAVSQRGHVVRRVAPDGTISTVAGGGTGRTDAPAPAREAYLNGVTDLAIASDGSLYLAEAEATRLRRVTPGGTITTVAGNGFAGFSGDYGPATAASVSRPFAVAVSGENVYFTDSENTRVRMIDGDGIIRTVAGSAASGSPIPGQLALEASIGRPGFGIAVLSDGRLAFSELYTSSFVHVVDRTLTPVRPLGPRCPDGPDAATPPDVAAPPDSAGPSPPPDVAPLPAPDAAAPMPANPNEALPTPSDLRRLVVTSLGYYDRRSLLRRGLVVRGRCRQPCKLRAHLNVSVGGQAQRISTATVRSRHRWSLRLRLTTRGRRLLKRPASRRIVLRLRANFAKGSAESKQWSLPRGHAVRPASDRGR